MSNPDSAEIIEVRADHPVEVELPPATPGLEIVIVNTGEQPVIISAPESVTPQQQTRPGKS